MTGDELRYHRVNVLKVTQAELASHLDLSRRTIQNWEALGEARIPTYAALAITSPVLRAAVVASITEQRSHPHTPRQRGSAS